MLPLVLQSCLYRSRITGRRPILRMLVLTLRCAGRCLVLLYQCTGISLNCGSMIRLSGLLFGLIWISRQCGEQCSKPLAQT